MYKKMFVYKLLWLFVLGAKNTAADTCWCTYDKWIRLWDHAVLLQDLFWNKTKRYVVFMMFFK